MKTILAIDLGGTKTATAVCEIDHSRVYTTSLHKTWPSHGSESFYKIAEDWLATFPGIKLDGIGIGIAGPITGFYPKQSSHVTNLMWDIDASEISRIFSGIPVYLCNDMQSHGWGLLALDDSQKCSLNAVPAHPGCKALIAAGTGLGESIIAWDSISQRHTPLGGEGGHAAFAPSDERDDELLRFLRPRLGGHVSWERVLGGRYAFKNLGEFMLAQGRGEREFHSAVKDEQDWGPTVIERALGGDVFCGDILSYYSTLYGREAANLALKCLPYSGLYIGGGIALRILPWLKQSFLPAFFDKGRFSSLMQKLPVYIIQEPENGLRGAALGAWRQIFAEQLLS